MFLYRLLLSLWCFCILENNYYLVFFKFLTEAPVRYSLDIPQTSGFSVFDLREDRRLMRSQQKLYKDGISSIFFLKKLRLVMLVLRF